MCGIAGIIFSSGLSSELIEPVCEAMKERLLHRGPDGSGMYICQEGMIGLVHTRLAILDLSTAGHQPMRSDDNRYILVFNGEIYNFRELRKELEQSGESFVGDSDTEVLLRCFIKHGEECVDRFSGMFAFAIWDTKNQSLFAARDPLGIKPLYFWETDQGFGFASEIRALLVAPLGSKEIDNGAVGDYLQHGSVTEPKTLIRGIQMLKAGHTLKWRNGEVHIEERWRVDFRPQRSVSRRNAVTTTRAALFDSVERHFVSDVPVGVFLSGGLDSTAIIAIAHAIGMRDIHTFSISFGDKKYDEGELAKRTANYFGCNHHEWLLSPDDARALLPEYFDAIDQPSIDGFNMFCVSKFARKAGVKVALSGLGGDELFGSYPSFTTIPRLLMIHKSSSLVRMVKWLIEPALGRFNFGNKGNRLLAFLFGTGSVDEAYETVRRTFSDREISKIMGREFCASRTIEVLEKNSLRAEWSIADQISFLEITKYMRNQLLRDSDVMSMAAGLELRVPFVDRKLMDTVSQIPSDIRLSSSKKLLVDAIPEIPSWVVGRGKKGFSFPFEAWFKDSWKSEFCQNGSLPSGRFESWYQEWCIYSLKTFASKNNIKLTIG